MSLIGRAVARNAREVVTVKRQTGHDTNGDATFGAAFTVSARIERTSSEAPDLDGRRVNGGTTLYTSTELMLSDLVWLPESDTSNVDDAFRPARCDKAVALDGTVTHWVTVLS